MTLDIEKEIAEIQKTYREDPRQSTFNCLLLAESGYGKTFLMRTARKPVHIDSFDPGGTKGLKKWIERGEIVVDARWERENPLDPSEYTAWATEFEDRLENGYFDHFATYVLDSATTWSEAIMNWVLKGAGIAGKAPRYTHDYVPQKIAIRNALRPMIDMPCDFFLTGHLELVDDPEGGYRYRFMTTGKGSVTIPLLFDEIYVMDAKEGSQGTNYSILTQPTDIHQARSRLASDGLLDAVEEADIKTILKKAGLSTEDKPIFG